MTIHLEPLTLDNWEECVRLEVDAAQRDFLHDNLYVLARGQFFPEVTLRAIYADDAMVGMTLYSREPGDGRWKIRHLMIDARFQRRGYGAQGLRLIMAEIAAKPDGDQILISYRSDNEVARQLYAQFAFVEVSITPDGVKATALWRREIRDEER